MSVRNVKVFFERVQAHESLRAKLKAVGARDRESSVEAIIRIATKIGLPFTVAATFASYVFVWFIWA